MRVEIGPILRTDFRAQGCYSSIDTVGVICTEIVLDTSNVKRSYLPVRLFVSVCHVLTGIVPCCY